MDNSKPTDKPTSKPNYQRETLAVHGGEESTHFAGAVVTPIFQSANYLSAQEDDYHQIHYIRLNNTPNHEVLNQKIALLEKAEAALVTSSGMAAISTGLLTVLRPGDHLLAQECLYGGTLKFLMHDLKDWNISVTWVDVEKPDSWAQTLKPNTKAFYVETIANPSTQVGMLDEVARFAKKQGLVSMIDNTIASPVGFQPITVGFDLVFHSATKYLNGHSDIVAGAIIGNKDWVAKVKHKLDHLGGSLDPHACFLLTRGIKTLMVRMRQHEQNAIALALFLEKHPKVARVFYPGLPSHPNHATAKRLFSSFSGLLSFELKGSGADAQSFIQRLQIALHAPSLGGVETLVICPARSSHLGVPREDRLRIGISDSLVRVSVGIEAAEDLISDFDQAL